MKRVLIFAIVFVLCLTALFSCKIGGNGSGTGDGGTGDGSDNVDSAAEGAIYGADIRTYIVSNFDTSDEDDKNRLISYINAIEEKSTARPSIKKDTEANVGNEIVLGETDRAITEKANAKLSSRIRREIRNSPDEDVAAESLVGYAIYAEGNSVAVVWSDWHLKDVALDYFYEHYIIDSSLVLTDGYTKTEVISLPEYLEERGDKIKADAWVALEDYLGTEYGGAIVAQLKSLYSLYTEENYRWVANLYDPGIGGWYWSNSARDNEGYLPSIEETYEALNYIADTGMAEMFDDDWSKAIPDWLKEQIVNFIYPLQQEDGFYYHPQWPKQYIEENGLQSRITRDKGSANTLLRKLGVEPKYSGYSASSSQLTEKLGASTAVAVSKAVAVSDREMLWQYQSADNFKIYLEEYEVKIAQTEDPVTRAGIFYSLGNAFQSTTGYINANAEIRRLLIEFFNKYQSPETGVWSDTLCYNMTNAVHKIGSVYNSIGAELQYVDQMVDTVFELLNLDMTEYPSSAGVDIYNAWSCFPYIYSNLRNYASGSKEDREAKCQEIKARVFEAAPDMIAASFTHAVNLRRDDGSFSYSQSGSQSKAQGCPIAVPGAIEGDMNGNGIAMRALVIHIMDALEAHDYFVPFYTEAERVKFMDILEELQPVIKKESELGSDITYDLEDVAEGEVPEDFTVSITSGKVAVEGSSIGVEKVNGNNVISFYAKDKIDDSQRNYHINMPLQTLSYEANASIIEFDLWVDPASEQTSIIELGFSKVAGDPVLYPMVYYSKSAGITIRDTVVRSGSEIIAGGDTICKIGNAGETIHLTIEYHWDKGVYKIYANGAYRGIGDTTYNNTAHSMIGSLTMSSASSVTAHYTIDNIRLVNAVKQYVDPEREMESEIPSEPTVETFEGKYTEVEKTWKCTHESAKDLESTAVDIIFDSGFEVAFGTGSYTNQHGASAQVKTDESGNKYVSIVAPKRVNSRDRAHSITLYPEECSLYPNAYILEMDFKADSYTPDGVSSYDGFLQFIIYGTNGKYVQFSMKVVDGQISIGGVKFANWDQWTSLRLQYHTTQEEFQLYTKDAEGNYVYRGSLSGGTGAGATEGLGGGIAYFSISASNTASSGLSMSIDNVVFAQTKLAYVADQTPVAPDYQEPAAPPVIPEYTITFVADESTHAELKTKCNTAITLPADPVKPGYKFDGWFFDNGTFEQQLTSTTLTRTPLTSDVKVYAKFTEMPKYTVTFVIDDIEFDTAVAEHNAKIVLPEAPEREGYTFDGWFFEDGTQLKENTNLTAPITEDVSVYAKYSEIIYPDLPGDVEDGPVYDEAPETSGDEAPSPDDFGDWSE